MDNTPDSIISSTNTPPQPDTFCAPVSMALPPAPEDKKSHKKLFLTIGIAVPVVLALGFFAFCLHILGGLEIANFKDTYTLEEFAKAETCVGSNNALWEVNGYDAYLGKCPERLPLILGENEVLVKEGLGSKSYKITLKKGDIPLLDVDGDEDRTLHDIAGDMDYDNDGLTNREEVELGTATHLYSTSGDGIGDGAKVAMGLDPLVFHDKNEQRTLVFYMDGNKSADIFLEVKGIGDLSRTTVAKANSDIIPKSSNFIISPVVYVASGVQDNIGNATLTFRGGYDATIHTIIEYDPSLGSIRPMASTTDISSGLETPIYTFGNYYAVAKTSVIPATISSTIDLGPVYPSQPDALADFGMTRTHLAASLASSADIKHRVGFLVDVGASMRDEAWARARMPSGYKLECTPASPCGNDPNFTSLNFIKTAYNTLKDNHYNNVDYRMGGFINTSSNHYCDVMGGWKNTIDDSHYTAIKNCSKPENFTGTDINTAIRRMRTDINSGADANAVKHIVIFSDGYNNNNTSANITSSEARTWKDEGIKVSFVCMSPNENCNIPTSLIDATSGSIYYSARSDVASRFSPNRLGSWIISTFPAVPTIELDGKTLELRADSGFRASEHGFPFTNFSTNYSGGYCYGFSYISKGLYQGHLPTAMSPIQVEEDGRKVEKLRGYTMTQENINRLYKYKGAKLYDLSVHSSLVNRKGEVTIDRNTNPLLGRDWKQSISGVSESDWQVFELIAIGQEAQNWRDRLSYDIYPLLYIGINSINDIISEVSKGSPSAIVVSKEGVGSHSVLATEVAYDRKKDTFYLVSYDSNATPGNDFGMLIALTPSESGVHYYIDYTYPGGVLSFDRAARNEFIYTRTP